MAQYDGSIRINTKINTLGLKQGESAIRGSVDRISSSVKKMTAVLASAFAVGKIVQFGKEAVALGSDLQEVQNVVDVTFTSMSNKVDEFAKNAAKSAGLSETMAKQYVGTFGAMSKSFGFTEDEAYNMSTALTQLAGDVASFYNISQDLAYIKLKSVFTGETETLKDLGVVMTQAALDQYALANGFGKTTSAMTEQEKVALRYQFVMEQLSGASGDFLRTSDGWANQVRVLKLQIDSLKATIGQGLINIFTPVIRVINVLLGKLATVANAFKAFTSLITGNKGSSASGAGSGIAASGGLGDTADGYNEAAGAADNLANSTEKAAKATNDAKKAAEGYLSPLDEINKFSKEENFPLSGVAGEGPGTAGSGVAGSAVDYGSLAEGETAVDKLDKKLLELKEILSGIIKPFKDAWESEGASTIESARFALSSLGELARSVAKSFYEVWTNGTGTQTLELILRIAQNVLTTIGNIAQRLNEAWNTNSVGTSIIQNIFNIYNTILRTIERITGATAEWAKTLDFTPLLTSINGLLESIQPLTENIGAGLAWFYENVLLPIAGWTIQEAVPAFLDMLSAAIGAVNEVIEALKPLGIWMWEEFLQPLGQWTGGTIISAMKTITDLLTKFGDWVSDHQVAVQNMTIVIGSFFAAFKISSIISKAVVLIQGLAFALTGGGGLASALSAIVSFLGGPVTLAITAIIATGILLWKNWDTIKEKAVQLKDWIARKWNEIKQNTSTIWSAIKTFVSNTWNSIKSTASTIFSGIKAVISTIWNGIKTATSTIWNGIKSTLSGAWNGIKTIASNAFGGVSNIITKVWNNLKLTTSRVWEGIVGVIKRPVNAIIDIMNGLLRGMASAVNGIANMLNSLSFDIPNWLGGGSFHLNIPTWNPGRIPRLAAGTVVPPNREFMAVLGDNKREPEVVSPLSTIEQAMENVMARHGSAGASGNGNVTLQVILDRKVLAQSTITWGELQQMSTGKNPFMLGTT